MAIDFAAHGSLAPFLAKHPGLFGLYPVDTGKGDPVAEAAPVAEKPEQCNKDSGETRPNNCLKSPTVITSIRAEPWAPVTTATSAAPPSAASILSPWSAVYQHGATATLTSQPEPGDLEAIASHVATLVAQSGQHLAAMQRDGRLSLPRRLAKDLTDLRSLFDEPDKFDCLSPPDWHRLYVGSPDGDGAGTVSPGGGGGLAQSPRLWAAHFRALCALRIVVPRARSHLAYGLIALVTAAATLHHLVRLLSTPTDVSRDLEAPRTDRVRSAAPASRPPEPARRVSTSHPTGRTTAVTPNTPQPNSGSVWGSPVDAYLRGWSPVSGLGHSSDIWPSYPGLDDWVCSPYAASVNWSSWDQEDHAGWGSPSDDGNKAWRTPVPFNSTWHQPPADLPAPITSTTPHSFQLVRSPPSARLPTPPGPEQFEAHPPPGQPALASPSPPPDDDGEPTSCATVVPQASTRTDAPPPSICTDVPSPGCSPPDYRELTAASPLQPGGGAQGGTWGVETMCALQRAGEQLDEMVRTMADMAAVDAGAVRLVLQNTGFLAY